MILSPYPLSPHLSSLSPYPDGDIRADFPANSAPRTLAIRIPNDVKIPLTVNFFPNLHHSLRAGNRTEPASFASLSVNFNIGHASPPMKVEIVQSLKKLIT
jgi:hypothetical protein